MKFSFYKQGIMAAILFISPVLYANDLGIIGQTYPIQEEDFLQFIFHRLQNMQQNGQWQKIQNQFSDNVKKHADRPRPVSFLSKTVKSKSWYYDPSITVPYDLKDMTGRVFAKAGTTVNPLKFVTIHNTLIFFDGDDKKQVEWVDHTNQQLSGKTKLILVNGSVSDHVNHFHRPIYFDQSGKLTSKFSIQHVPAMVVQEVLHLKISEVAP